MGLKITGLIVLLLLAACADRDRPTLTFDTTDLSTEQQAAFYEAQAYWEAEFSDPNLFEPGPPYNSIVHFTETPPPHPAWIYYYNNGVEIRFSPSYPQWNVYSCFRTGSKHELGHSIGLPHSLDPADPMFIKTNCTH